MGSPEWNWQEFSTLLSSYVYSFKHPLWQHFIFPLFVKKTVVLGASFGFSSFNFYYSSSKSLIVLRGGVTY